ncbi:MAG: tetratricopeptide repeat protein [Methanobacterium sp.]|uniref:tetratricopeptide repeat protein n=1 Tax=Methanobacterium sp. TaxID=2164 RepID=UPI003D6550C2|nr:tetratricopeptide repeat protein [Methanobacterium sp.]
MTNNQAKKLYQTGIELMGYGKSQEAINYFREAVEANPSCMEANLELGYLVGATENYEEALKAFDNALKIQKTFPGLFGKGICHFFMEEYGKSLDAFMDAQEIGENEDLWYYLGSLHLIYTDNIEGAINCFDMAISINEKFIEAWNDCGVAYSILENDETALVHFKDALDIDPEFKPAIYNMGATLVDMERYEESLKYLDRTLESEPDNFKALFYKGNALYSMEKEEEAVEYFKKALKVDKDQEELWNYLGYIQSSIGQNHEAIESLNQAIKLNNDFEEAYINLGNVYLALGKDDLALDRFKRVLEIYPDNEEILREIEDLKGN